MSRTADPEAIVRRLNRNVRKKNARLRYVEETPFGGSLAVHRYRLGNGLEVLLLSDDAAPVVSYHSWYRVGSRHEQPGKTGLAHFFEHLMFKETKSHGPGEFDRLIEAAGGDNNAATWTDWTNYHDNLPSAQLELAVQLESDRMTNLVLQEPQVESEREVVINERRQRVDDDVEGAMNETLYATAYRKHPYRWPTIGWMEDIERYAVKDCLDFYRTYYAPNDALLVLAGDFDEEDTLSLIQQYYGPIAPSRLPALEPVREPTQRKERRLVLSKPTDTEKVQIGWHGPGFGERDYAVLVVLNEILCGGRSSRLYGTLVHDREIASDLHGSPTPFRDPGLFEIFVNARPGRGWEELLQGVDGVLDRLVKDPPTEAELEKAKNRLELFFLHGMETAYGRAEQLGFYATVLGDASRVFGHLDEYRAVTATDVLRAARRYFDPRRRTVIAVIPEEGAQ